MLKKKIYLNNIGVLNCLNEYLPKKTATILLGVSKIMKECIFPKKYRDKMLLLNTSDIAKIKMFIESDTDNCTFYHLFNHLTRFKYITTRFHHWNKYHWAYVNTFIIYRYTVDVSVFPLLNLYISTDHINFLQINFPVDIQQIYNSCLMFPFYNTRGLIML
jgi:hypothetical protein